MKQQQNNDQRFNFGTESKNLDIVTFFLICSKLAQHHARISIMFSPGGQLILIHVGRQNFFLTGLFKMKNVFWMVKPAKENCPHGW